MEGFSSTNSLSTLLCPVDEEMKQRNCVYSSEFQAMLDGLDDEDSTNAEEEGQIADKKRRLSYNQVKALEGIFEVNNKLDPGRKVALAKELGLQPRQVAIWFQNRRARWKIKQLEMDYNKLKASYESLKLNYDELEQNKGNLTNELQELKAKIGHKNVDNNMSTFRSQSTASRYRRALSEPESSNNVTNLLDSKVLSDTDSSGVLNEETNHTYQLPTPNQDLSNPGLDFYPLSEMNNYKMFPDSRNVSTNAYQQQWMKVEDGRVFGDVDESNFFSVDQVPSFW